MLEKSSMPDGAWHVVITGGAGCLSVRLARTLLAQGPLCVAGAPAVSIAQSLEALRWLQAQGAGLGSACALDAAVPQDAHGTLAHADAAVAGGLQQDVEIGERRVAVRAHVLAQQVYRSLTHRHRLVLRGRPGWDSAHCLLPFPLLESGYRIPGRG